MGPCSFPPNSKPCDTSEPITVGPTSVRRNNQPETENVDQNEEEQPITGSPAHSEDISCSLQRVSSSLLECRSKEQDGVLIGIISDVLLSPRLLV